jgi:hypothetical protein
LSGQVTVAPNLVRKGFYLAIRERVAVVVRAWRDFLENGVYCGVTGRLGMPFILG